jgi:hypothetical protein
VDLRRSCNLDSLSSSPSYLQLHAPDFSSLFSLFEFLGGMNLSEWGLVRSVRRPPFIGFPNDLGFIGLFGLHWAPFGLTESSDATRMLLDATRIEGVEGRIPQSH